MSAFVQRLARASERNKSLLCIGLDPDPGRMPIPDVFEFNKAIIDSTADLVCAYKPNFPFYEALGVPGLTALERTVRHIRDVAPDAVLIGDSKRGDIGSTNRFYARALFETWGVDAATVNAWGGGDSVEPYLDYADRGVFVWCRSSNPGAAEFQDVPVSMEGGTVPLYEWLAIRTSEWNVHGNVGLVVGATYPEQLGAVRARCPGIPILIPGVGAQGGDLADSIATGLDTSTPNMIISSSRGVIYASSDPADFAGAARSAAIDLRDAINERLDVEGRPW